MKVVKRHKRLWIVDELDQEVYTPPSFIHLQSREPLAELANKFKEAGCRSIAAIVEFESAYTRKRK